jgi:excisionase family DNA binding protein
MNKQEKPMTNSEIAEYLSINLSTLYRWRQNKLIKYYRIGRRIYYYKSDIDEAMIEGI